MGLVADRRSRIGQRPHFVVYGFGADAWVACVIYLRVKQLTAINLVRQARDINPHQMMNIITRLAAVIVANADITLFTGGLKENVIVGGNFNEGLNNGHNE